MSRPNVGPRAGTPDVLQGDPASLSHEKPLLVTMSPAAHFRGGLAETWTSALQRAGIVHHLTIPQSLSGRQRIAGDLPPIGRGLEPAQFMTDWASRFRNAAGVLAINFGRGTMAGVDGQPVLVSGHLGAESDRAMQRARALGLGVVLSEGYPVDHPSPFMHPEALSADGVRALDPHATIEARVAQLPGLIGGLLIEPPGGGGQVQ